ncbi:sphingomyelin synthetase, putative [Entamoeba dispar SAW760]|uniref:Sphingomyelin synthetase, putative n=1 Tax=Entamoeba dispar (strain ATCC PRA-260 / SAW760) TaxID=370354 RepID=B0EM60_ENTDS|nr:sphingomyelin synthetase, putative [Entamoeba dispar SAW760]EDR24386.1 sphingomyelin synthetase, putative [Entamoeba dispar SAW760]|eukprot:EDR24386.1 sphingomyelin synthetase, putative [Entamoeba dispar SAW760]
MNRITGTLLLIPREQYPQGIRENLNETYNSIVKVIRNYYQWKVMIKNFFHSQLFWGIISMIICGYWNSVFQIYADSIAGFWKYKHQPFVLMDIFFDILPYVQSNRISDLYLKYCIVITIIRFLFTPLRSIILRRYCFIQAVIFLFRGFSVFATLLPNPMISCKSDAIGNPFVEGFYVMLGYHHTCADLLFSGHTANLTVCAFIWEYYSEKVPFFNPLVERICAWVIAFIGYFIFLANHFHYSCDVFIGFIVAGLLFNLYHTYIKTISTRNNFFNSFLRWFEEDSLEIPKLVRLASKKTLLQ